MKLCAMLDYGTVKNEKDLMRLTLYHSDKSHDGSHISASSVNKISGLKGLSNKTKKDIKSCIETMIEVCSKEIFRRKDLEMKSILPSPGDIK